MTQFSCFDCKFDNLDHPCRTNGAFDPGKLARVYFENVLCVPGGAGGAHWSFSCVVAAIENAPDLAWEFIEEMLPLLSTPRDVGNFAAGPVEDIIAEHGQSIIERIEAKAENSARFRYVLSGVWPLGQDVESEIWQRVCWAREPGPFLDNDDPIPAD